jgi:Domain of unknown function (DUF4145)
LEKTLKANGYTRTNDPSLRDLQKRIDAAAADGVISDARRKRAHEDIRSLGNDVLHDDWRDVIPEEVENAHRYTQRILEDLYDDRATVEALLIAKNRIPIRRGTVCTPGHHRTRTGHLGENALNAEVNPKRPWKSPYGKRGALCG